MRGTFVVFPGEGSWWIDFKYEFLPEYCFVCGCLGHLSRICLELRTEESGSSNAGSEALLAFAGLSPLQFDIWKLGDGDFLACWMALLPLYETQGWI
ncbi:uncharacterized protein Pyn_09422 [Prunus yedoensis var. nudiflora]|uniref:Zinc knuckle CX2CX4HX4C domain-containing protein n=1 Tax=Prunus yedoensis var. nudiflora TaxID=2094558 RepID=A0A314YC86_PRUYE|nr:uncharacterized protein Pyn_09422 [Prunus yedoensis var. nudiflora]